MSSAKPKLATPALTGLQTAADALARAGAHLRRASVALEDAEGPATRAKLLGEETRDVLARINAEREKLLSKLP